TLYHRSINASAFIPRLLIHSSRGLVAGTIISGLALAGRMRGKEEIEWQDRSWRLIENKGQSELDYWIIDGGFLGAVAGVVAARKGMVPTLAGRITTVGLGGAGVGAMSGTAGYMGWRLGVRGAKFD